MKRNRIIGVGICLLALLLIMLVAVAIIASLRTGRSFDECFFGACCGALYVAGMALGFSYKEICVIVNIYIEAGLCLLSGLWVTWVCISCYRSLKTWGGMILMLAGIAYGLIYVVACVELCKRYAMPMNDAFDLCYKELIALAGKYHTTYNNVNYVIFILFFLVCTLGNVVIAKLIKKITCQSLKKVER